MKVHFSIPNDGTGGVMVGVSIDVCLLEKSRVITHGDGERAYHCFYQLLAQPKAKPAEKAALLKGLHLGEAEDYVTPDFAFDECPRLLGGYVGSKKMMFACAAEILGIQANALSDEATGIAITRGVFMRGGGHFSGMQSKKNPKKRKY